MNNKMAALVKFSRCLPALRHVTRIQRSFGFLSTTLRQGNIKFARNELNQGGHKSSFRYASVAASAESQNDSQDQFRRRGNNEQNLFEWTCNNVDMNLTRYQRVNKKQFDVLVSEAEKLGFKITREKCLLLLRCTGESMIDVEPEQRVQLADMLWAKMKENGVQIDHSYFNFLLASYLQNGHKFSPTDILAEMQENGVSPNRVTYQRFISAYCQNGDVQSATQILDHMKNSGMPVSADAFHSFITGHLKAGDKKSAENVLNIISEVGLEVTSESYSALLNGLAEMKDYDGFKETLKQCENDGVLLKSHHLIELIITLLPSGNTELSTELMKKLGEMRRFTNLAINKMNQLFSMGEDDLAYQIYCVMPKDSSAQQLDNSNRFFLRFMAKNSRPVDKVYEFMTDMKARGFSQDDIREVAHLAYLESNPDYALEILDKSEREGLEIPPHCYLPALCQYRELRNKEKMIEVMKKINSYDPTISNLSSVMLDYWIPSLTVLGEDSESIQKISRDIGIVDGEVNFAFGMHYLVTNGVQQALNYISDKPLTINTGVLRQSLERAMYFDKSWSDAIKLIQICQSNFSLNIIGGVKIVLRSAIKDASSRNDWSTLEELVNTEFDIPTGDMKFVQAMQEYRNIPGSIKEKLMAKVTNTTQSQLDEERFSDVNSSAFSPFSLRRLAIKHVNETKDLEKASQYLSMLSTQYPEFPYYEMVLLDTVSLCLEHGKAEEGIQLLKDYATKHTSYMQLKNYSTSYRLSAKCQEITTMATSKCPDAANQVIDTLVTSGYINPNSYSLLTGHAQLVLKQENDDEVLKGFEEMVTKHQHVSLLPEFLARFIKKEDPTKLQKVIDLALPILGEKEVLSNLVVTFVVCGHPKKAMKVFETPGVWLGQRVCDLFVFGGHTNALEQFVNLNRDTDQNFREELLFTLIRSYSRANDPSKALDVLVQYEEENITPRPRTLRFLAKVLEGAGLQVPFTVPQIIDEVSNAPKPVKTPASTPARSVQQYPQVVQLAEESNVEKIMEEKSKLSTQAETDKFLSELLLQMFRKKKMADVHNLYKCLDTSGNTNDLLTIVNSTHELPGVIRSNAKKEYLLSLLNKGQTEEVEKLIESRSSEIGTYLTQVALEKIKQDMPKAFSRIEELAEQIYNEAARRLPLQKLFSLYVKTDLAKAQEMLQKYPKALVREDIVRLGTYARINKNTELVDKVTDLMRGFNKNFLALAYSYSLDIHTQLGELDQALETIKKIENDGIAIKDIHTQSIQRLEKAFTDSNRQLPWKSKTDDSSSSDSDSSADEKAKQAK